MLAHKIQYMILYIDLRLKVFYKKFLPQRRNLEDHKRIFTAVILPNLT
jgi:hypothetical protein